jgi:cytoskeleton protein RodZ
MTKQQTDNEGRLENSLGDLLHKTRTAHGKTLEEAAEVTRIHVNFLRALEENNFEKLPAEVFTRGFIRLYATYLGLDPDDTFHHYLAQEKDAGAKSVLKPFDHDMTNNEILDRTSIFIKKRSKVLPVTILLLVLIVFYLFGIFFRAAEQPSDLPPEPAATTGTGLETPAPAPAAQSTGPSPAEPVTPRPVEPAPPPAVPEPPPVIAPPEAPRKIAVAPRAPANAPPAAETAPPLPAGASQPVGPAGAGGLPITVKVATEASHPSPIADDVKYVLEARFEQGSRVGIKVDDKPRLQYDSQAGIVRIWRARESIVLNLDNRAGVSLTLNGKPLPINGAEGVAATISIPADLPEDMQP